MGTTCCLNLSIDQWINLSGVIISLLGIVVTAFVAVWVVKRIQNKITDNRFLKDYFISEIKWVRDQYRSFADNLLQGSVNSKDVLPWFKLLSVRSSNLIGTIHAKYNIGADNFREYHMDLLTLISECESMTKGISKNSKIQLTQSEKNQFIRIQQQNAHIFNDTIICINDAVGCKINKS